MAPILDTSGLWTAGDDYRIIQALGLPFGTYTRDCIVTCCNDLQGMSTVAQQDVLVLLADYEAAKAAGKAQNLTDVDGKVLVKVDVIEYEVQKGQMTGPQSEKLRVKDELGKIFSFCSCLGGAIGGQGYSTPLIRS